MVQLLLETLIASDPNAAVDKKINENRYINLMVYSLGVKLKRHKDVSVKLF